MRKDYQIALQKQIDRLAGPAVSFGPRHCNATECPHYRKGVGDDEYACHRIKGDTRYVEFKQECLDGLSRSSL